MKLKTKDLLGLYSLVAAIFSALFALDCYVTMSDQAHELMIQIGGVSIASVSLLIAMLHATNLDVYVENRKMAFKIALFTAIAICVVIFS